MSDSDSYEDLQELVACPGLYREITDTNHHINNKTALVNILGHVKNDLPWLERMDVVVTQPAPAPIDMDALAGADELDPDDDFKRENCFYRIAQAAVLIAIPKIHELGLPTKRPADYFAEMVKSDQHMTRVKKHLVEAQQRMSLRERARDIREKRKFGKQTKLAVLEARREEKKKLDSAIKATRKKSGKDQHELLDELLGDAKPNQKRDEQKAGFNRPQDVANRRKINHARDFKNKKYGHGGQKKRGKRNTADSASGTSSRKDFDPKKHQDKPRTGKKPTMSTINSNAKSPRRNAKNKSKSPKAGRAKAGFKARRK